jgi:hypothetical protein
MRDMEQFTTAIVETGETEIFVRAAYIDALADPRPAHAICEESIEPRRRSIACTTLRTWRPLAASAVLCSSCGAATERSARGIRSAAARWASGEPGVRMCREKELLAAISSPKKIRPERPTG